MVKQELDLAYANAYANSLWGWGYIGSYAMTNDEEYFAEGLQVNVQLYCLIPISLQPLYHKLRLFNLLKFIVRNIKVYNIGLQK